MQTLSDRLNYILEQRSVSQAELAKRIGVNRQAIQYICANPIQKSKLAFDIAGVLNISDQWLISGKGYINNIEFLEVPLFTALSAIKGFLTGEIDLSLAQRTAVSAGLSEKAFAYKDESGTIYVVDPEALVEQGPYLHIDDYTDTSLYTASVVSLSQEKGISLPIMEKRVSYNGYQASDC